MGAANPPYISYYRFGGATVALRRANQPDPATDGQYRLITDQLGSTLLIIDSTSATSVVQRTYYKPYGEVAWSYGGFVTTKGYTGQRLDTETGLLYYGARYYDPVLSYFISPDPLLSSASHPQGFNRYSYVWDVK